MFRRVEERDSMCVPAKMKLPLRVGIDVEGGRLNAHAFSPLVLSRLHLALSLSLSLGLFVSSLVYEIDTFESK